MNNNLKNNIDRQQPAGRMFYLLKDHLGSITGLVNENGELAEEYCYDAWGRRCKPDKWTDYTVTEPSLISRSYTGHEYLDMFALINMNGRLYDPLLGRMLSPDNFVQSPQYSQGYNRYAYCSNNPLKFTDPNGETYVGNYYSMPGGVPIGESNYVGRMQCMPNIFYSQWMGSLNNNNYVWAKSDIDDFFKNFDIYLAYFNSLNIPEGVGTTGGIGDDSAMASINQVNTYELLGAYKSPDNPPEITDLYSYAKIGSIPSKQDLKFVGNFHGAPIYEHKIFNDGSAITLPPLGIIVGEGVYTNMSESSNLMIIRHEFGHWLQYEYFGDALEFYEFYGIHSAKHAYNFKGSTRDYMLFWTEKDANLKSWSYLHSPTNWDMENYPVCNICH